MHDFNTDNTDNTEGYTVVQFDREYYGERGTDRITCRFLNTYTMRYRPAGFVTLPPGIKWDYVAMPSRSDLFIPFRRDLPAEPRHPFGVIRTNRPLTRDEMKIYEVEVVYV